MSIGRDCMWQSLVGLVWEGIDTEEEECGRRPTAILKHDEFGLFDLCGQHVTTACEDLPDAEITEYHRDGRSIEQIELLADVNRVEE